MTITCIKSTQVSASSVLYNEASQLAIAREAIANQIEAMIEIASDMPEEYVTYDEVEGMLEGAKETTIDFLRDAVAEFEANLIKMVQEKFRIEVEQITFNRRGFEDANVKIVDL